MKYQRKTVPLLSFIYVLVNWKGRKTFYVCGQFLYKIQRQILTMWLIDTLLMAFNIPVDFVKWFHWCWRRQDNDCKCEAYKVSGIILEKTREGIVWTCEAMQYRITVFNNVTLRWLGILNELEYGGWYWYTFRTSLLLEVK